MKADAEHGGPEWMTHGVWEHTGYGENKNARTEVERGSLAEGSRMGPRSSGSGSAKRGPAPTSSSPR